MFVERGCEGEVEGFLGVEFRGWAEGKACEAAGGDFGADAGFSFVSILTEDRSREGKRHTLIVTVAILLRSVKETEDLEDVAFTSVGTEGVSCAVEAEDEFSFVFLFCFHDYTQYWW